MYFNMDTPYGHSSWFQRHAYQLLKDRTYTLAHYLGASSQYEAFPHRRASIGSEHYRTLPSYMEELKQKADSPQLPSVIYKTEVATAGVDTGHLSIRTPRNIKQVHICLLMAYIDTICMYTSTFIHACMHVPNGCNIMKCTLCVLLVYLHVWIYM